MAQQDRLTRAFAIGGIAGAAVFVLSAGLRSVLVGQVTQRAAEAATYRELLAVSASYRQLCWALLVVSLGALAAAAVSLRMVTRRRGAWRWWIGAAGGFAVHAGCQWWLTLADSGRGGGIMVDPRTRPSPAFVALVVDRVAELPYRAPGPIGTGFAVLLLAVQIVYSRAAVEE